MSTGGGQGNWGPWPVTALPPGDVQPGEVKIDSGDASPGYLLDKIISTTGTIAVTKFNGPPEAVNINVVPLMGGPGIVVADDAGTQSLLTGPALATLIYNYNLADFTGIDLTNAGLLSAATESYGSGFGPMIQSANGASSTDCEYGLGIAGKRVLIYGKTVRNDLSGGTGTTSFHATRNGVIVATLDVIEGAGSQDPTALMVMANIAGGAITDTFGLSCTNGTGPTEGALTGRFSLIVLDY